MTEPATKYDSMGDARHSPVTAIMICSLVATAAAACGGQPAAPHLRPSPAAAPSSAPLSAWEEKGATTIPPESVAAVSLNGVGVNDRTGGSVSDHDSRLWAQALLRTDAYDLWAENNLQDGFLLRSGLSRAPNTIFTYELTRISQARAQAARIVATAPTIRGLSLRTVPRSLQATLAKYGMSWSPYAFYMDEVGPSGLSFVAASGTRTTPDSVAPGVGVPELVGGEQVRDPVLGPVWVVDFDIGCADPTARRDMGALCSQ